MVDSGEAAARSKQAALSPSRPAGSLPAPVTLELWAALIISSLLTGGAVAAVVGVPAVGASQLQMVSRSDLDQASASLPQPIAAQAAEEARQCKTPLPYVTLQTSNDTTPNRIRIRSAGYVSPWLLLNGAPERIAVPLPAAYSVGKGELIIEGPTRPLTLWLNPPIVVNPQPTAVHVPVAWNTSNPCPP